MPKVYYSILFGAWAALAQAGQPSAGDLERLRRSLNPTPTPSLYGLDSHISAPGQDVDAQGNHLFSKDPGSPQAPDREARSAITRPTPTAASDAVSAKLHATESQIETYEQASLISRAQAASFRERLAFLRIRYGLRQKDDVAGLSTVRLRSLSRDLDRLKKSLLR